MTPKDLEDLAALINERWPHSSACVLSTGTFRFDVVCLPYAPLLPDLQNASFIVWCLDRLDELLVGRCVATVGEIGCMQHGGLIEFSAPTRAEACARALLEALRREKE